MVKCHAPGCSQTTLCHAHIVPAGFARTLSDPAGHNRAIRTTGSKAAKQPHGMFDSNILCRHCDERLGRFDEYAIKFCASLPMTGRSRAETFFEHKRFDGATFARAMIAIFWRASLSSLEQFNDIDLGPYQDLTGRLLFSDAPLSTSPAIKVVLLRYGSSDHDARKFIFMPLRIRSGAINAFTLGVGGFLVWAKFDQRPIDHQLASYVINQTSELRAPIIPFEITAEYDYFQAAAAQDRRRPR